MLKNADINSYVAAQTYPPITLLSALNKQLIFAQDVNKKCGWPKQKARSIDPTSSM